jgi:hypothetical protein
LRFYDDGDEHSVQEARLSHKRLLGIVSTTAYTERDNQCQLEVSKCPANRYHSKRMMRRKQYHLSKPYTA